MNLSQHQIEVLFELVESQPVIKRMDDLERPEGWEYPEDIKGFANDVVCDLPGCKFLLKQIHRKMPVITPDKGFAGPFPARLVTIKDVLDLIAKFAHRELRKRAQKYMRILRNKKYKGKKIDGIGDGWYMIENVKFYLQYGYTQKEIKIDPRLVA